MLNVSRSRKDGRNGGGHKKTRELWSRRCPITNMWTPDKEAKIITHRYERRVAKATIEELWREMAEDYEADYRELLRFFDSETL